MIRLRIPETPDYFVSWLKAWNEMVSGDVRGNVHREPSKDGRRFVVQVDHGQILLNYEMEAPDILWITGEIRHDPRAAEADHKKTEQALDALARMAAAKWTQDRMTYDDAFGRIQAGEDKRQVKRDYLRWNPEKTDNAFYKAMQRRKNS